MTYTYASYSDIGKRANNEDALNVFQNETFLIAVVADGLGGHSNGELAAKIAVESIPQTLTGKEFGEDELGYAILRASEQICETRSSACTTVASLWIQNNSAIAAHVGDSRIYQFRGGQIVYQSEDHSMVQVAITLGELPRDACRTHKERNKVYRALGEESERLKVDICELEIRPGDRFVLCSDGFWEPVTEGKMLAYLDEYQTPEAWLEAIKSVVRKSNNPKQDNNTAIIIYADS